MTVKRECWDAQFIVLSGAVTACLHSSHNAQSCGQKWFCRFESGVGLVRVHVDPLRYSPMLDLHQPMVQLVC
jgi:hypothetical protein